MSVLNKLRKPVPDRDRVVIVEDNGTADIAYVYDSDDITIYAESGNQDYALPLADLTSHVGPSGRIYTLRAEADYVADTKRLAALEKSIVLRHVTQFVAAKPEEKRFDFKALMLYLLIGALLLAVIFR